MSEIAVIRGHVSSVRAVAYLPTGTYITSASLDGSVKIWSADHGKQVGSIMGHMGPVNAIAYTSNGREMVTVSEDGKVKIWSSYLGKLVHKLKGKDDDAATCVSISPSVTNIAVGYHSGKVRIFNITTGEKLHDYQMHTKSICTIRYSPDEKFILTGSADTTAKMFVWTNGHCKQSFTKHSQPLLCADICSKFVVTAAEDISCYLYFLKSYSSEKSSSVTQLQQHDAPISACTFSFDEVFLVTAGRDKKVVIWDLNKIWQPHRIMFDCHRDWITDCKMSKCGEFLVTCSNDFLIKVWNTRNGTLASTMTGHMAPINAVSYRKQCVTSACSDGSVKIWSDKGFEVTTLFGHSNRVNDCDMRLQNEDVDLTEARKTWANVVTKKKTTSLKRERSVTLATCSDDGLVNIWEPLTLKENFCLKGHSDQVLGVSCTNKGVICSCSKDGSLRIWSVPSGSDKVTDDNDHDGPITGIIYSPITDTVITSSRDGTVKFWNASNLTRPKCITTLKLSESSINCMCFYDVKGTMFATGTDNRTIVVWQIVPQRATYTVKKMKEYTLDTPVVGLESWPTTERQTMLDVLISYTRKTTLTLYTLSTEAIEKDDGEENVVKFSSVKLKDKILIISITDDRNFLVWEATNKNGETSIMLEHTIETDWLLTPETLLTAVFVTEKLTFIGDSSGQVHWQDNSFKYDDDKDKRKNITTLTVQRNVAITCILVIDEIIVTASADNVLRMWKMDMEQIAQFYCLAPVTNMTFCQRTQTGDIHIVVGDQLGKIYFLTLKF
uniref:Uncharacterized protein n=1 Tax=Octopus bimaculoides TaxID=37653 RepID=A0A0L8GPH7_OCTBM